MLDDISIVPILAVQVCRIRQAYDKCITRIVSCTVKPTTSIKLFIFSILLNNQRSVPHTEISLRNFFTFVYVQRFEVGRISTTSP